jgi:hypothetical protein
MSTDPLSQLHKGKCHGQVRSGPHSFVLSSPVFSLLLFGRFLLWIVALLFWGGMVGAATLLCAALSTLCTVLLVLRFYSYIIFFSVLGFWRCFTCYLIDLCVRQLEQTDKFVTIA